MSDSFKILKHRFETGFTWSLLSKKDSSKIKETLKDKGHGCYVLVSRDDAVGGTSFGSKSKKAESKTSHSVAAYVFELVETQYGIKGYIFLRELEDGNFYFLKVENGYIQKGSDVVISLDEAKTRIAAANDDNNSIYIDSERASWIANGIDYKDISLEETIKQGDLKPNVSTKIVGLNDQRNKILLSLVILALSAVILLVGYWSVNLIIDKWKESQKVERKLKTKSELALENRKAKELIVAKRLLQRTKTLSPKAISMSCIRSYFNQDGLRDIGGWDLNNVVCKPDGLGSIYVQNDIRAISSQEFADRVQGYERMKVSMSPNGRWMGKATVKNTSGFVNNKVREGITLEELPSLNDINNSIMAKLRDLKLKGVYFGDIREAKEIFSEEDNVPEDLPYMVGNLVFVLPSLDRVQLISELFNYNFVQFIELEIHNAKPLNLNTEDKSLKYVLKISYFYR